MHIPQKENKAQKNMINEKNIIQKPPDKNINNYKPNNIHPPKEEFITSLNKKKENNSQSITKNISNFLNYLLNSNKQNNNNNKNDNSKNKNENNKIVSNKKNEVENINNDNNNICPNNISNQKNISFSSSKNDNICNKSSELSAETPENKNDNCVNKNNDTNNKLNINEFNKKEKTNINENIPKKDDNAIYLIDSDDDKEENKNLNNNNNLMLENNNNNKSNLENNYQKNENNNPLAIQNTNPMKEKENINPQKEINPNLLFVGNSNTQNESLLPNLHINNLCDNLNNNKNNNLNDKNNINNILNINNGRNKKKEEKNNIKYKDKKLYYRRKLKLTDHPYKGKDKLNIQFVIGNYKSNELFPSFIFDNRQFFYTPRNYRQTSQNSKGYYITFPNLIKLYGEKLIEKDLETMCTYYFRQKRGKQSRLDIKVKDEKTLNDGVFLNDGIVNFYLKIIEDEYTFGEGKTNQILIQKSFFYNSLAFQNSDLSNNEFYYPESCSFIKTKINVFSFKTLIIPICEHYHWSLIIVNDIDKMKNIFTEDNLKDYNNEIVNNDINLKEDEYDYPEIFYLDSLYHINDRRTLIILKFLFYEYQKIYSIKCNMELFFLHNYNKIERYNPNVPKQNNNYDCGIFILMYAELFLYNPDYFLKYASNKYKKKNDIELNKTLLTNDNVPNNNINNKISNISNNYIINNNIINNINIANNSTNNNILNNFINIHNNNDNIFYNVGFPKNITNENINSDNITKNNINTLNMNENQINNNINQIKKEFLIKLNNNKENMTNINQDKINNNASDMSNKTELSLDNMDIEIEYTKNNIKDNENIIFGEYNNQDKEANNEQNENQDMALNEEIKPEEESLKNWFSWDLVNNQRNKIKNLIKELSNMEKEIYDKNNIEQIRIEQDIIIKKYMEKQKKEFDEYFFQKKELKNN